MNEETLRAMTRIVPDFPKKGIRFVDLTTLFKHPECLEYISDNLYERFKDKGITKVAAIEARGFICGGDLARRLGAGFVPIRKKGKLPAETIEETLHKEYGNDVIEIHKDAIGEDDIVLLHDDFLATGGTTEAAVRLLKRMGAKKIYACFIAELDVLKGREAELMPKDMVSLLHF